MKSRRKRIKQLHKTSQRIKELEDEWKELCSSTRFEDAKQTAQRIQELRSHLDSLQIEHLSGGESL